MTREEHISHACAHILAAAQGRAEAPTENLSGAAIFDFDAGGQAVCYALADFTAILVEQWRRQDAGETRHWPVAPAVDFPRPPRQPCYKRLFAARS